MSPFESDMASTATPIHRKANRRPHPSPINLSHVIDLNISTSDRTLSLQRARNTLAARRSRQQKMEHAEKLERDIAKLSAERDHWKALVLDLERGSGHSPSLSEVSHMEGSERKRDVDVDRI